jgi:hypothetical protein
MGLRGERGRVVEERRELALLGACDMRHLLLLGFLFETGQQRLNSHIYQ